MLTVTIHLGKGDTGRELARLTITNDGTGTKERGNYLCDFVAPDFSMTYPLRFFRRELGVERLVAYALEEVASSRTDTRLRDEYLTGLTQPATEEAP